MIVKDLFDVVDDKSFSHLTFEFISSLDTETFLFSLCYFDDKCYFPKVYLNNAIYSIDLIQDCVQVIIDLEPGVEL